jgi:hypothetical protein
MQAQQAAGLGFVAATACIWVASSFISQALVARRAQGEAANSRQQAV